MIYSFRIFFTSWFSLFELDFVTELEILFHNEIDFVYLVYLLF